MLDQFSPLLNNEVVKLSHLSCDFDVDEDGLGTQVTGPYYVHAKSYDDLPKTIAGCGCRDGTCCEDV